MGELYDRKGSIVGAIHAAPLGQRRLMEAFKRPCCLVRKEQLARVGPCLGRDGRGLEPEKTRAARCKAQVPPRGERVRAPVQRAVAALHGLNRQPVGGRLIGDAHRLGQGGEVCLMGQRDAQLIQVALQVLDRPIVKGLVQHAGSLLAMFGDDNGPTVARCVRMCQPGLVTGAGI